MSRTNFDFSKHRLDVKKTDDLLIHHLNVNGKFAHNIKFINTNGICAVTGDYGNWIFNRELHPSSDGFISDDYIVSKLRMASNQEGYKFSAKETRKCIEKGIESELEEYGYEDEKLEEAKDYYRDLLDYVDCEDWVYRYQAYNDIPDFMTAEDVPYEQEIETWLLYIFDAFEEICRRIKEDE